MNDLRYKHWFEYRNGRVIFDHPKLYRTNLERVRGKRGFILIYEESEDKKISNESRGFYFKVLIGALVKHQDFYAFSPLDVHHEMMRLFNATMVQKNGEWVEYTPSMNELNGKEWNEYLEKIRFFVESKGITITEITGFTR